MQENKKRQERMLSTFLEKKNCKFLKPCGNRILVKYDSTNEAKNMLQGMKKPDNEYKRLQQIQNQGLESIKRIASENKDCGEAN